MKRFAQTSSSMSRSKPDVTTAQDLTENTREAPSFFMDAGTVQSYHTQPQTFHGTSGADRFTGSYGSDTMYGSGGPDEFNGASGTDTVDYSQSNAGVDVRLGGPLTGQGGDAQGDRYVSVENVIGSDHDDILAGTNGANILDGRGGNDTFHMDGGADQILGGSGDDTLIVSGDNSVINLATGTGSGGNAEGDVYSSIENVNLGIGASGNTVIGSNGSETVNALGSGNDIDLGGGNDTLNYWSNTADGELNGGSGSDTIDFGLNPIVQVGGGPWAISGIKVDLENGTFQRTSGEGEGQISSFENIIGTGTDDEFIDDRNNNTFTGGSGADTFAFNHDSEGSPEIDTITDFEPGTDKIDLSGIEDLDTSLWFQNDLPFEIEDIGGILNGLPGGGPDVPPLLESWIEQDGDDVKIHTDFQNGDYILLEGVSVEDLSMDDFVF